MDGNTFLLLVERTKLESVIFWIFASCSYLWFAGLPGIGCVELLEHILVLGLDGLFFVDVVNLRLPAAKHQDHWARLDAYSGPRA